MKIIKPYPFLLTVLLITCASREVVKNNIKINFKSLANDFAAVDMALYDDNKFEIKTATLEMHGNEEFLLEIEGIWNIADSNYILTLKKTPEGQLMEYLFGGWENQESSFEILSENKVSFPIEKEFLIINNVMCQKQ